MKIIIISILILSVLIFSYYVISSLKKTSVKKMHFWITILLFGLTAFFILVPFSLIYDIGKDSVLVNLYSSFSIVLPLITIAYVFLNVYSKKRLNATDDSGKVEEFVERVFSNEKFNTAFTSVLPKGVDDEQLGLNYIPIMLQATENKRKKFSKQANIFLTITLGLGLLFISIVIFFGYILINDSAVGISKSVRELRKGVKEANLSLFLLNSIPDESFDKQSLDDEINGVKTRLIRLSTSRANILLSKIQTYEQHKDLRIFASQISGIRDSIMTLEYDSTQIIYKDLDDRLAKYRSSLEAAKANFSFATAELGILVPKIEAEINKEDSQLNEIIKRLILSIVIVTFFLAILRYTANLYTRNHRLMINAEEEDMRIRKFYVALKNTDKNMDERKAVIENFIGSSRDINSLNSEADGLTKEDAGVLKELLNGLMKKL